MLLYWYCAKPIQGPFLDRPPYTLVLERLTQTLIDVYLYPNNNFSRTFLHHYQSIAGFFPKFLSANELPQPQALSDTGLFTTANALRIMSSSKSTFIAPFHQ